MAKGKSVLKKIKRPARVGLLCYLGDVQGCGTIRVIYPYILLNHIREKDLQFNTQFVSKYVSPPDFYRDFTFTQFQRSATKQHIDLFKHYKSEVQQKYKVPLIYEIDDLLINIPEWNYAHVYYKEYEENVRWLMSNADGIVCSTPPLKEIYSAYNKNITVVPNHLPKFVWQDTFPAHDYYEDGKKIKILWAGSQNHFHMPEIQGKDGPKGGDFGKELMKYIRSTVDIYEWNLMGAMPVELRSVKDKIKFHQWENIFNYPRKMKAIEPDICIAPLEDNIFNSCKCITKDSMVITDNGIKTINEVSIIDRIWQEDSFKIIEQKIRYKKQPTIKIRTYNGYEIEGTYNHRLKSKNEFKILSELEIGDTVDMGFFDFYKYKEYQELSAPLFLTKKLDAMDFDKLNEDLLPKVKVNERWGRFIGYILGDGHLRTSNSISISCSTDYQDIIDDIVKFAKEIGLISLNFVEKKVKKKTHHGYRKNKGVDVVFNSRNLKWFLGEKIGFKGVYCKNLNIPDVILKSPKSVVREFIRGLFEADGGVSKDKPSCYFTTKHKKLATQIQFLLLGFGIKSRIISRLNKQYNRYYYTLILNRQACDIFYKEINFISGKKKEKLKNITEKKHSNAFKEWELNDEIVEIMYGEADVYDIQVPDGEYYLANGIISHNSNIKCLEYSAAGAAGIYSDVTPYKAMTLRCKTDVEFIHYIEKLATDINFRARTYKKDRQRVEQQLFWEEHNNLKKYVNSYLGMFGKKL